MRLALNMLAFLASRQLAEEDEDSGGPVDAHFASVVLLARFDGADGATTFYDDSSANRTLTAAGNAQIDTAQSKFGGSSALFDGTGDYISAPDSADWRLSAANADPFTVEAWVRMASTAGSQTIVCQNDAVDADMAWQFTIVSTGVLRFQFSTNGTGADVSATSGVLTWTVGQWYHVAADKDATGKIRVYRDGVMAVSATPANSAMFNSTSALTIGGKFTNNPFNGWIDGLRITKGVARYASDSGYTVPTEAWLSPIAIRGTPVTAASQDLPYAGFTVTASGGTAPYSYAVTSGALPAGIALDTSTGVVSGTPTGTGTSSGIVIGASDAYGTSASLASFSIAVTAGPAVVYCGTFTNIVGLTAQTASAVAIGPASASRLIVVAAHGVRNAAAQRVISTVSIGGTNGTIHGQTGINDGVNDGLQVGVVSRVVATGTTADIVLTWTGAVSCSAISVFAVTGLASTTAIDTTTATGNNPTTSDLSTTSGGIVIAAVGGVEPTTGAFTLTGTTADYDAELINVGTKMRACAAHATGTATSAGYTVTASSAAGFEAFAATSWA